MPGGMVDDLFEGVRPYPAGRESVEHDMVDEQLEFLIPTELSFTLSEVAQVCIPRFTVINRLPKLIV